MNKLTLLLLPLCFCLLPEARARASGAVQSDWSGGSGVPGPVPQWSAVFDSSLDVDWSVAGGPLILLNALPNQHVVTSTLLEPACVTTADLDGDTDLDIVSVAVDGNEVVWFENDGSGGGWTKHQITGSFVGPVNLSAPDVDRDGDLDVAAVGESGNRVCWWANDGSGGGWTEHVIEPSIPSPFCVYPADFDQDNDVDFSGAIYGLNDVVWWENTDGVGGAWVRHTVDASALGSWCAVPGDIDGDGDPDIAASANSVRTVAWYANDGTGATWVKSLVDTGIRSPTAVYLADLNGDTHLDIMAASYVASSQILWYENDGTGTSWVKRAVASSLNRPFSTQAADMDGDGDLDVLGNERAADKVSWWENVNGAGTVWLRHMVDLTSDGPNDVISAHIDGDSDLDIVATFSWANTISWYELVDLHVPDGTLESSILDAGEPVSDWGAVSWLGATPASTSLSLAVRASNDTLSMGTWVDVAASGDDLSNYVSDGTRYLQYRVHMTTGDPALTPALDDVRVAWYGIASVGESDRPPRRFFLGAAAPSPASSDGASIRFGVPRASAVELALYDAQGRKVRTITDGFFQAGEYETRTDQLRPGVYLCQMRADGFVASRKLVVR